MGQEGQHSLHPYQYLVMSVLILAILLDVQWYCAFDFHISMLSIFSFAYYAFVHFILERSFSHLLLYIGLSSTKYLKKTFLAGKIL